MKNPKSILTLVFLFTGFLFQAYANPTEKVMRLKGKVALVTRVASGSETRRGVIVNTASKAELLLADGARICY